MVIISLSIALRKDKYGSVICPYLSNFGGNKKWISNTKADHIFKTGNNPTIICTSAKDAIFQKKTTGIDAYSFQSESHIPFLIEDTTTHIVRDNDEAGVKYANKMSNLFGLKVIVPISKDVYDDVVKYPMEQLKEHYLKQL